MIKFISLASGSSGNCYYLATPNTALLIDAGISDSTIQERLAAQGLSLSSVLAVLLTHNHADHVKGVGKLGDHYGLPVYATRKVHEGINRNRCVPIKLHSSVRYFEKESPFILGDFRVTAFSVPHDRTDNVGYFIEAEGINFCLVTDLGRITPTAANYMRRADYLVLEADYDEEMLRMGTYEPRLKSRIAGPRGHLSNTEAAGFVATLAGKRLKQVWFCHVSEENNRPERIYEAAERKLSEKGFAMGKDLQVTVLERTTPSQLYELGQHAG